MQLVDQAVFPPNVCAVTGSSEGPFVDTLAQVAYPQTTDPHVYLKPGWIQTCASQLFGMVSAEDFEAVTRERDTLKEQLREADKIIEAADVIKQQRRTRRTKE